MKLEFIKREEISDIDIINNISEKTVAILLHDEIYWIEVYADGSFGVNNGWSYDYTTNILEAIELLNKFINDNN